MEYNTSQKKLILPEYGRNIQTMVQYAVQIKDRDERNIAAHTIIAIMGSMQPHLRDILDFKHKLWDHLAIMSEFKLDIDSPYPNPSLATLIEKPKTVPYPQSHIRQKHYGKFLIEIIREAIKISDEDERGVLVQAIATQMKKSYNAWNRELMNDDLITQDLYDISDGKLVLDPAALYTNDSNKESQFRKKKLVASSTVMNTRRVR